MLAGLSFEQAPPLSAPLRFFLTAPLFGVLAGLLLLYGGPPAVASRWTGAMLAFTHLLTIGFMLQTMCGALLQLLPVAAGGNMWRPGLVAGVTHSGLTLGALLLAAGFAFDAPQLFRLAAPILAFTVLAYSVVLFRALMKVAARGATVTALRLSALALALTGSVGALMAGALGWGMPLPLLQLTDIHAAWGLLGWSFVLLAGIAYLVVPMFQLTPPYDLRLAQWLPIVLFAALALWSVLRLTDGMPAVRHGLVLLVLALVAGFALVTLQLQRRRRRKVVDPSLHFWRLAMVSLLAGAILALSVPYADEPLRGRLEIATGVLLVMGTFASAINGMLYRIVPFLNWLHLQRIRSPAPNVKKMLPEASMRQHYRWHLAALGLLLLMLLHPWFAYPAGVVLIAAFLQLERNLVGAARLYRVLRDAAPAAGALSR